MLAWIIVGVLFIALIFALIKSAMTWTWIPITTVCLIFITAVLGGYALSYTFKSRSAWIRKADQNAELAEQASSRFNEVMFGPEDSIGYSPDSHQGLNGEVNLMQIGKGRIWEDGQPSNEDGSITVTFSKVGLDGETTVASQMLTDMTVYAFANRSIDTGAESVSLPTWFLGSFSVSSIDSGSNSVTLKPLTIPSASTDEVAEPKSSWSLFERMPGDSRTAFLDDLDLEEFSISAYRQALRDKYLTPEMVGLEPDSKEYEALLDEYSFDGLSIPEINAWIASQPNRINDNFDPLSVFRETELLFNEKASFRVDGDGNPVTDGPFSQQGEANMADLKLNREAEIPKEQSVRISTDAARIGYDLADGTNQPPMTSQYDAESIVDYYSRPLRDYPYALQVLSELAADARQSIKESEKDVQITQAMIENTNTQLAHRSAVLNRLQQDIAQREQELQAVNALSARLEAELNEKRQTVQTYYEQILEMYGTIRNNAADKSTAIPQPRDPLAAIGR